MFGELPPPPRFDSICFSGENEITIKDSFGKQKFDGTYSITANQLEYSFHPSDVEKPIIHKLPCSLSEKGRDLILTYDQSEMVYYRAEYFYPNSIAGEWTAISGDQSETMKLGEDGSYELIQGQIWGFYRLWPSHFGMAMTVSSFIPGHGQYMMIWQVKQQGKRIVLTPITPSGLMNDAATVWAKK
jgi:hypothetical protein